MSPTAVDYVAAGIALVPIPNLNGKPRKGPTTPGWNLEKNAIRTIEQASRLNGCNIGLAHAWSRTCCWDIDDYLAAVAWLSKSGIALDDYLAAEDAVQIVSGRENRAKLCYKLPDGVAFLPHVPANGRGFELRCASRDGTRTLQDLLPPSIHEDTLRPYMWQGDWRHFPALPEELLVLWRSLANGPKPSPGHAKGRKVREGDRNAFLMSLAGSMRRKGFGEAAIRAALLAENEDRCGPPLPDAEVVGIAKSAMRYAPGQVREEPPIESYEEDARRHADRNKAKDGKESKSGETGAAGPPVIDVIAGALPRIVQDALDALKGVGTPVYLRGDALYRPVRIEDPPKDDDHVRRPIGAVVLRPIDSVWARLQLAGSATWRKWDARGKARLTDPPKDISEIVATQSDIGNWPVLRTVASHPAITTKGRVVSTPGYDKGSGLLIEITGAWPIPTAPTKDDAVAAWERLKNLLRHFPWVSDVDRTVAICLLMTAIARPSLPAAPMHAIDAPEAGTGKSLLVDVASILASGTEAPVMDYGRDAVEAGKRLDAMLLAGDPLIAIDNIEAPIEGAALCQTLTQTARRIRVLGLSKVVTVPCVATLTATGNNLVLRGDVVRRVLLCRLDAKTERPELRDFDQDLIAEASEHRRLLVADIITIMLAYQLAGRPDVEVQRFGSYEPWSRMVRQALVWVGAVDPCLSLERTRGGDPSRLDLGSVLEAWHAAFGSEAMTAVDVVKEAWQGSDLREALAAVCERRGVLDTNALGYWLRTHRDRRSERLVLRAGQSDSHKKVARWAVLCE